MGFDIYESERPVKSKASQLHEDLERIREENAKLRKKVLDYQMKFSKLQLGVVGEPAEGDDYKIELN